MYIIEVELNNFVNVVQGSWIGESKEGYVHEVCRWIWSQTHLYADALA